MEVAPLFAKKYGEGRPLFILHGLFGMGDNWATHAKLFAEQGWEVHAIDQRNHGRSPQLPEHNYDAMVADLEAYMDTHGIEKATMLGHSMGGKTVMHFAVARPARVEALIVVDIAPKSYPVHHQVYIDAMQSLDFNTLSSRKEADELLAKTVFNEGIRQFFLKSLYRKTKDQFDFRFNLDVLADQIEFVGEALEFGYYDAPTLFIAGAQSGYILPEDHQKIFEHFPQARIHTIEGAGHWVHAEAFEEFSTIVLEFLDSI
ncbi:MAG: hypothetical protein RLZZ599_1380 [Bacteroidota bacterium]|jgi:pimeloyl-ACP methyl ester carboxylesterase